MATASPQVDIEDLVTCPICMERMKNPKHLYCQHAFCAQCLRDWTMQPGNPKGAIVCPICRKKTPVHKGIEKLPTHIGVIKLLDMLEGQKEKETRFQGFACGVDGAPDVAAFCESCGHHLCGGCLEQHLQNQTLWPHLLYIDGICCTQHSSRVQNKYCNDCQKVGCHKCMQEQHKNHDNADLSVVAKMNRSVLLDHFQPLEVIMANAQKQTDMISVYALERKFKELKQQIDSHTTKGHMVLDIWKKAILADLKLKSEKLGKEVSEVEEQLGKGASLVSFMKRFLQEGSDFQLVTAFPATSQKMHKATDSLNHVARRQRNEDYDLAFVGEPIAESFGSLQVLKDSTSSTQKQDHRNDTPTQAKTQPAKSVCSSSSQTSAPAKSVCSSSSQTTHSGEIPPSPTPSGGRQSPPGASGYTPPQRTTNPKSMEFDVTVWRDKGLKESMELHDSESPSTERSHKVKNFFQWVQGTKDEDLEVLVTVFMCNKTGYLYFGEAGWWTKGNLWRLDSCINLSHNLHNNWGKEKVMGLVSATSVAVSPVDGMITACVGNGMIAVQMFGDISKDSGYGLINQPSIKEPYSIAISDKHWVVVDKRNNLVAISAFVNGVYRHLLTFGSRGSDPKQFCEPSHVCCDSLRDRFIVSDTGNNRVQVFDMSGNFLWVAGQAGGRGQTLNKPHGLCVDGPGNIIVADSANHRLVVLGWETGNYLREIRLSTVTIPHSITVDGRDANEAYLVIAGLKGKMPVVQTWEFVSPSYEAESYRSSCYRYNDY